MLNDKMDFVSAESKHGLIEVIEVEPKVVNESGQLLARLPQQILLRFTAGSKDIDEVGLCLSGFCKMLTDFINREPKSASKLQGASVLGKRVE